MRYNHFFVGGVILGSSKKTEKSCFSFLALTVFTFNLTGFVDDSCNLALLPCLLWPSCQLVLSVMPFVLRKAVLSS